MNYSSLGRIMFCIGIGGTFWLLAGSTAQAQVSISCPPNITQVNDPGLCAAVVTYTTPVGTGSGTGITTALTQGLPSGATFDVGTTQITYTVTNDQGDTDQCTFFVTVQDIEAPVFDCPPDISVDADPATCSAVVNFPLPDAIDNCGFADVSQFGGQPSGSTFAVGEYNLDFEAFDLDGNRGFCRVRLFVVDVTDPSITCPADLTFEVFNACDTTITYTAPVGSDGCSISDTQLTAGNGSGGNFPVGTTTETYTVTDLEGNTASCSFTVTVIDAAPPNINCPADISANAAPGTCEAVVNFATPAAADNCPGILVAQTTGPASGAALPAGETTVEFTATDASGNQSSCLFTVTVTENDLPAITCPADILTTTDDGQCAATVSYTAPVGTDNCSGAATALTSGLGPGASFPVGINTETYTVTDASGNEVSCSFTITVEDEEAPVFNCLTDLQAIAESGSCFAEVVFADPIATDNCVGVSPVSVVQTGGPVSGSDFPVGTTFVEFTATDDAGNSAICSFGIEVSDTENPTINCPTDFSFAIPGGACSGIVSYADPVIADNCPGVSFSVTSGPIAGDVLTAGVYLVELQAVDAAGNSSDCSLTITVSESSDPVFDCPADITVPSDAGTCDAVVLFDDPLATDSCSTVTVSQTSGAASGSVFPLGSTAISFTAVDLFGNSAVCSFNIIVEDQEIPVVNCPGQVLVGTDPGLCEAIVTFPNPTFSDNCPGATISQTGGAASGSTFSIGTTPIEFTAVDAAGNTSLCTFDIIVADNEMPAITCPADFTFQIPDGDCTTPLNYPDPIISDNCPGMAFAVISGPASGDLVTSGIYPITFQAVDAAGNTADCSFTATVTDKSIPVFDCPADVQVNTDSGACDAVVNFINPTAIDSCSTVTVTQTGGPAPGSVFPIGNTLLEFTAVDPFGNSAMCSYTVSVMDTGVPSIECPANITGLSDPGVCGATINYALPTANDDCGIAQVSLIAGVGSGNLFPIGTTTETYEVTDVSGNTATCSFDVTIADDEDPVIACPADITINIADGNCTAAVDYALPLATDNCSIAAINLIDGPAPGGSFNTGTTTVTFEVLDPSGNAAICSFMVTVLESVAPQISCPANITVPNDPGTCAAVVIYSAPVGMDECPGASTSFTSGLGSGANFPVGITTETYTVTDASGNSTSCSFTVTVLDDELPVFECLDDIALSADVNACGTLVNFPMPPVTDLCDGAITPVQIAGPAAGSSFDVGATTVTFQAVDAAGNTATCSFVVTVTDEQDPEISCPTDISILTAGGACEDMVNFAAPAILDNCPGVSVSQVSGPASGSLFPIGETVVSFEAADASGNTAACSFTVTLTEDLAPTISCPENISVENDLGLCTAMVNYDLPVAADNCDGISLALSGGPASGAAFPEGTTTVTYTATDASGNDASCSFTVTVVDLEMPVIDCPADTILSSDDSCGAVFNFDLPTANDNCTIVLTVIQNAGLSTGDLFPLGESQLSFTATDDAGNTATCNYTVTVMDDSDPEFSNCQADIIYQVATDSCTVLANFEEPIASDNCNATLVQTAGPEQGAELGLGVYLVEFTATDDAGNSAICAFTITVEDTISPELTCPDSFQSCDLSVVYDEPVASDNCQIESLVLTSGAASGATFPIGLNTITYTATDASGNSAECSFTIEVLQPAPAAMAGDDQNNCESRSATLSGNAPSGASPSWSLLNGSGTLADPTSAETQVTGLGDGINTFVYSLDPQNGCEIMTDTVHLNVEPNVTLNAGSDALIFAGAGTTLSPQVSPEDGSYSWQPPDGLSCTDCSNPTASPRETAQYFLTYTTPLGCTKTDSLLIRVFRELPNTITPDGDGTNDVWNIPGIEKFPDAYVVIYNRWGNEVFASSGYREPWDGSREGEALPTGSYFYVIDYKVSGVDNLNGTVSIIR